MMTDTRKIALVTGANQGIGLEVCWQLATLDIMVVLSSRDSAKGEQAKQQLKTEGLKVVYHQLDVTDDESINNTFAKTEERDNRLKKGDRS